MNATVRPETTPALLSLTRIGKTYVNGDLSVQVLHDVSIEIRQGEFVAIVGQSGSGKTTLMNILGCLDQPSEGTYQIDGVDVSDLDPDEIAYLRRDTFGFVFQSYNLIPTLTALENVELPATYRGLGQDERQDRAEDLLTELGLGDRTDHRPGQLSGGQQQRVSIARALMNGGKVILADEPTGALDSRSGEEVMGILKRMRDAGHTVIVITHDRKVASLADRTIEISDGRITADQASHGAKTATAPQFQGLVGGQGKISGLSSFVEAFKMGWRALVSNPLRTALTLLGIVIGVSSVIVMLAIGGGSSAAILDRISGLGSNQLNVSPGSGGGGQQLQSSAKLTTDDAKAIAELPNVASVVPQNTGNLTLRTGSNNTQTSVTATWANYPEAMKWEVGSGTFFTDADEASYATVAVLGKTVVENLFPDTPDPIGEYFIAGNFLFQVIGVMSERGSSGIGFGDPDNTVFVPLSTGAMRLFGSRSGLRSLTVIVEDTETIDTTEAEVTETLIGRHGQEDFRIRNNATVLETVNTATSTFTILLGAVASISLLVGGIGIMNIMLVNVTERTREIGIRMATGARMKDILRQFNIEAVVVSAIGGLIGVGVGLGLSFILKNFGIPIAFSITPVAVAFGCAFTTGLVFGYLPARKAARLDPVVALAST
jgi:macrolide transport system ATP-binding/permease protein